MRDFMVVGAGMFGATFAQRALRHGKSCIVFDKSPHVAGAAHDIRHGDVNVSQYGAHIFHTSSEHVWSWVNEFGRWHPFTNRPKVLSGSRVFSFPINMMTLHQLWGVVTPAEAYHELQRQRIPCADPRNFEEWALSQIGEELYRRFIYGYTKKQYFCEPSELPASIIKRLPIRLTYDENYFTTKYQAMPVHGYTSVVTNMLDGIEVQLGFAAPRDWQNYARHLVYTGRIDAYFDYCYGRLDYNSMRFEHSEFRGDYQGNAVFNHADATTPYLRSIEHRHFAPDTRRVHEPRSGPTIVSFDYPSQTGEPYYPILSDRNLELYAKYASIAPTNVTFGGRLGEYRYYDMDQTIASALQKADKLCKS